MWAYVLLRHQFDDDSSSFRVTCGRGRQLKIKLLRGCKKVAKLTIAVDELLALTSQGNVKLHFSSDALILLERSIARQDQDETWFTPSEEEDDSDSYYSCTDQEEHKLPSLYMVRLPTRRRPETLPLTWRLRLEQEEQ